MHGLVFRTMQCFIQDTYGPTCWTEVTVSAGLDSIEFEAMLQYDPGLLTELLDAASDRLKKPVDMILEDIGTYLVSHNNTEGLRRLLRFGGTDFTEFLHSLDELPGRARLAVPDLDMPDLELLDLSQGQFELRVGGAFPGFGQVLVGILRSMADDYGTLALLEHIGSQDGVERIEITLVQTEFSSGRAFELAVGNG